MICKKYYLIFCRGSMGGKHTTQTVYKTDPRLQELVKKHQETIMKNQQMISKYQEMINQNQGTINKNQKMINKYLEMINQNKGTIKKNQKMINKYLEMINQNQGTIKILMQRIEDLKSSYQQALKQAKKLKNPALYRQMKEKSFSYFLQSIEKLQFDQKLDKKSQQRHHVLVGNISVGKTSLINMACGLNLPVAVGECTRELKRVAQSSDSNIKIFDSPGNNDDFFTVMDIENLRFFYSIDRIFIVYCSAIKDCKEIVQVLAKLKKNDIYMVRSKCDTWEKGHQRTIKEQIEIDKNYLMGLGLNIPVLAVSAKKGLDFEDNKKFVQLLRGV